MHKGSAQTTVTKDANVHKHLKVENMLEGCAWRVWETTMCMTRLHTLWLNRKV
jgi:hypothetical protein